MSSKLPSIDISSSSELLDLVEEVQHSGVGLLLKRGDQELAVLSPVSSNRASARGQTTKRGQRDSILNIIGIGASKEPTDVAQHELEYLAEAYEHGRS